MGRGRSTRATVVPGLERGLRVLEHLACHPGGQGLSDIAAALRCPLNGVFRVTHTLLRHGYVERHPHSRRFFLTRKPASLAYGSEADRTLMENALDLVRELRDRVRETVVVSILDRGEGLILEQVPGLHPFRFVCEPGTRQPMHASASTKAILAFLPDAERAGLLGGMAFPALTRRTLRGREAFLAELVTVRSRGYATDRGETLEGVHCVAAPVRDRRGRAIAAITVTGPAQRMPERGFAVPGALVRECAARISARFGFGLVVGPKDTSAAS
jgi:DNA-binding IclR family transcriptional regulator